MAVTSKRAVLQLSEVKDNSHVSFKTFGMFFLKLIMLSVEDQEFITGKLLEASKHVRPRDCISIITFKRPKVKLGEEDNQFRFIFEHEFMCTMCGVTSKGETNCAAGFFRSNCESCQDRVDDYTRDSVNEKDYD